MQSQLLIHRLVKNDYNSETINKSSTNNDFNNKNTNKHYSDKFVVNSNINNDMIQGNNIEMDIVLDNQALLATINGSVLGQGTGTDFNINSDLDATEGFATSMRFDPLSSIEDNLVNASVRPLRNVYITRNDPFPFKLLVLNS